MYVAAIEVKSKGLCWQSKNGSNTIIGKGHRDYHEVQEHNNQIFFHVDLFIDHTDGSPGNGLYR